MYLSVVAVSIFAFLISVPFGYFREDQKKLSWQWFALIHLPIPFIVAARYAMGLSWHVIPILLIASVGGQIIGSRANRARKAKSANV